MGIFMPPPSNKVYSSEWSGKKAIAPSKNAVYNKIEALIATEGTATNPTTLTVISTVTNFPAASAGTWYKVTTSDGNPAWLGGAAGSGFVVNDGDLLICVTTTAGGTYAAVGADWNIQRRIIAMPDGYRGLEMAGNTVDVVQTNGLFVKNNVWYKTENRVITPIGNDLPVTPGVIMPMGTPGAGVGICPADKLPTGYTPMSGYADRMSPNFGNYQYLDGSVVVFRPKYYYKIGTGSNGLAVNQIDIQGVDVYASTALANAAGYALCRSFIDGGVEVPGKFDDKYKCSKVSYGGNQIASSIKNGLPLSTAAAHNPIADLTACSGSNTYADTIRAAKARNAYTYCMSVFDDISLARISMAHGQKSFGPAFCGWYSSTKNYPKGCNNNALADTDDTSVVYLSDGYSNCGKTGSAWLFDKTTHNGQACGVADLNGLMYETRIGLTCIATTASISAATKANPCQITTSAPHGVTGTGYVMITGAVGMTEINDKIFTYTYVDASNLTLNCDSSAFGVWSSGGTLAFGTFYVAKEATAMKNFTHSNTEATDHWGATGVAAMMQAIAPVFETVYPNNGFEQRWGSGTNQVLSEATSGDGWLRACCGFPKDAGGVDTTGTDLFGKDYFYQYIRNELCVRGCYYWSNSTGAGVWSRNFNYHRTYSSDNVGFRCSANSLP